MKKIIIIIILLLHGFILLNAEDDNTGDTEIAPKGYIDFFWKEKFSPVFDASASHSSMLRTELNLSFEFPFEFYTTKFFFDNTFMTEFNAIVSDTNYGITDGSVIARDMLANAFITGTYNRFKIKNIMKIDTDLETGIYTPFNDYPVLYLNPCLSLYGSYYTGFFWEVEHSFPMELDTYYNTGYISTGIYILAAYEFFRFYGPMDFKMTILTEDNFVPCFYLPDNGNSFSNEFRTGIFFDFLGFTPSSYFIMKTTGDFNSGITSNSPGINSGLEYTYKPVTITFEYTGTYDVLAENPLWQNRFDISIRLDFSHKIK